MTASAVLLQGRKRRRFTTADCGGRLFGKHGGVDGNNVYV